MPASNSRPLSQRTRRRRGITLSQWRREHIPTMQRHHLFKLLVDIGAIQIDGTRVNAEGFESNLYRATEIGIEHGLKSVHRTVLVAPGRERDLKQFIESRTP